MLLAKNESRLWVVILWAVGLLLGYFGSIALPWIVFIWGGPSFGLLAVIVMAVPWLAVVRCKPVGFNMAYFSMGMLLNVLVVLVSWCSEPEKILSLIKTGYASRARRCNCFVFEDHAARIV